MAVVSVKLKRKRQVGRTDKDRTGQKVYYVVCDNIADGPDVAETANDGVTAVPAIGDSWSSDPDDEELRCTSVQSEDVDEDGFVMQVTCDFSTTSSDGKSSGTVGEDPLERPADESWSFSTSSVEVFEDAEGTAILNSAGDPFDPSIEAEKHDLVAVFKKNVSSFDIGMATQYMGAVNSDTWRGQPPETCKVTEFSGQQKYENGKTFVELTINITVRTDKWTRHVLDQGIRALPEDENPFNTPVRIRDSQNNEVGAPVLLDGNGRVLPAGGTPHFIDFYMEPDLPFSALEPYLT